MARIETWFDQDLQEPVKVHYLKGNVFESDNKGNLIGVNVYNNGTAATLSGSVTGYCVLATGWSIPVAGTINNNKASIILPEQAYKVPGQINIVIKNIDGANITTLAAVVSTVFGIGDVIAEPSTETIEQWEAQINATLSALQNGAVRYDTAQSITTAQKTRARNNIGANTTAVLIADDDYRIVIP